MHAKISLMKLPNNSAGKYWVSPIIFMHEFSGEHFSPKALMNIQANKYRIDLLSFERSDHAQQNSLVKLFVMKICFPNLHRRKRRKLSSQNDFIEFSILIFSISQSGNFSHHLGETVYSSRCVAWKLCH